MSLISPIVFEITSFMMKMTNIFLVQLLFPELTLQPVRIVIGPLLNHPLQQIFIFLVYSLNLLLPYCVVQTAFYYLIMRYVIRLVKGGIRIGIGYNLGRIVSQ